MKISLVVTLDWPEFGPVEITEDRVEVARRSVDLSLTRYFEGAGIHVTTTLQKGLPTHPFPTP